MIRRFFRLCFILLCIGLSTSAWAQNHNPCLPSGDPPSNLACPSWNYTTCQYEEGAPSGTDGEICVTGTHGVDATGGVGPYTYASSDTNVATVDADGVVTALSLGSTTITITDDVGCTGTATVTVVGPVGNSGTICIGSIHDLDTIGGQDPYTYTSDDLAVATVDGFGVVTAVGGGIANILITDANGCTGSATITVSMLSAQSGTTCVGSTHNVNSSGGTAPYTYESSDTSVATVDASTGEVTGVAVGSATITVTDSNGCVVTASVNVNLPISATGGTICRGDTHDLATTGGAETYTYTSSDTSIATVDDDGIVTGVLAGTVTITISDGSDCEGTASVTVTGPIGAGGSICIGSTLGVNASGGQQSYTYSSDNTAIATVDGAGIVTGVAAGGVTITIMDAGGCTGSVSVTVLGRPSAEGGALCVGSGLNVNATGGSGSYNYVSSDTSVAGVDGSGLVTGVGSGSVTITVTDTNDCSTTVEVVVNSAPSASGGSICQGGTFTVSPSGGAAPYAQFISSNTAVASIVANNGTATVTGLAAGVSTISFTDANGCTGTVTVTVSQIVATVSPVCVGGTQTVFATGCAGPYTYSSSDTSIAFFEDPSSGVVTGAASGSATITVRDVNGSAGTATLVVMAPPTASGGTVCVLGILDLNPQGGTEPYTYTSSDSTIADAVGGIATGFRAGSVTITITDSAGCSVQVPVTVAPVPTVSIISPSSGASFLTGQMVTIQADANPSGGTYTWVGVDSVDQADNRKAYVTYSDSGTKMVSLAYQSSEGCYAVPSALTLNIAQAPLSGTIEWVSKYTDNEVEHYVAPVYNVNKSLSWLSGERYFSDGEDQSAQFHRTRINVLIKCPGFGGKTVYLRALDVDDPTPAAWDEGKVIDPNDVTHEAGNDNRDSGSMYSGQFYPLLASECSVQLNSDGIAMVEFVTSSAPGDNFRIAAALVEHLSALNQLQVTSSEAADYVAPTGSGPNFSGVLSPALTIWRKLWIEIDSMTARLGNLDQPDEEGFVEGYQIDTPISGRLRIQSDSLLGNDEDYYAGGRMWFAFGAVYISGNSDNLIQDDHVDSFMPGSIVVSPSFNLTLLPGAAYKIRDDDDRHLDEQGIAAVLPVSDQLRQLIISNIRPDYAAAFIEIMSADAAMLNLRPEMPFELNAGNPNTPLPSVFDDAQDVICTDYFWSHTVVLGYQPTADSDADPSREGATYGLTGVDGLGNPFYFKSRGMSAIYVEMIREGMIQNTPLVNLDYVYDYPAYDDESNKIIVREKFFGGLYGVIAHEVGHGCGGQFDDHYEMGLMTGGQVSSVYTHDFSALTIKRFRGVKKWR